MGLLFGALRGLCTLVAFGCALAAALGVAGVFYAPLDGINHFAPMLFALATVSALLLGALKAAPRSTGLVLAGGAMAVTAMTMAPEFLARALQSHSRPLAQTIKVVELNVWSNNRDLPRTLAWLEAQHADVVVLEEVVTLAEHAPEQLKAAYPYHSDSDPAAPCTTLILSRRRPTTSGVFPSPDSDGLHCSAWATFGGPGGFTVVGDHAVWPRPSLHQETQSALLASRLMSFDHPSLIVAGDFNSTPWSYALRRQDSLFRLERRTRGLFTFPAQPYTRLRLWSPVPLLPLDHIYAGSAWKTVSVTRGARTESDHLATVAVLTR